MQILGLLLSLSILVFVHELGHLFFARLFKTRVEKFYLFFNPYFSLFRAKKYNGKWHFSWFSKKSPDMWAEHPDKTEWGIGWVPLGGYCSIAGMIDETKNAGDLASEPQPWEYRSKKAWQRLLIILGGVLVNFVCALVIYVGILFYWGQEKLPLQNVTMGYNYAQVFLDNGFQNGDIITAIDDKTVTEFSDAMQNLVIDKAQTVTVKRNGKDTTFMLSSDFRDHILPESNKQLLEIRFPFVVKDFISGSAAQKAGMQINDSIVSLNKVATPTAVDFMAELANHPDEEIIVGFYRNQNFQTLPMQLDGNAKMGVYLYQPTEIYTTEHTDYGIFSAIPAGIQIGFETLGTYVKSMKLLFTKEGASQLGGFGAIGSLFPKEWNWSRFWEMTAFLSIILAFMNILPIPALDGGHVAFTLYEIITRRKPSDKFMERAQMVGIILLLALLIYANGNDLIRWLSGKF